MFRDEGRHAHTKVDIKAVFDFLRCSSGNTMPFRALLATALADARLDWTVGSDVDTSIRTLPIVPDAPGSDDPKEHPTTTRDFR